MSGFDPTLLHSMGIEEVDQNFPLPIYVTHQMSKFRQNGLTLYHAQPRPLSEVSMMRLIFQIKDYQKFIR